ncbi:hypothetical protein RJI07_02950 [Mycoplasmatota bacterium WC30]
MLKRNIIIKLAILFLFIVSLSSTVVIGYAYWNDLTVNQGENLSVGDWGIPITTAQEFYDFATKSDSVETDRYYLFNDIDFSGFTWDLNVTNNSITFRGTLDGNGKTLSNLTIYTNSGSYQYIGIFPRMEGGSVYNITLSNINLSLGSTALGNTSLMAGLITGNAYGLTNTINDITIISGGVRGTSALGTGGLVGYVSNSGTSVIIDNIKATNLRVFSKNTYSGGLVGNIGSSGSQVTISDIDIEGEVYSSAKSSYTGGVVGRITSGGILSINRAIVEMTSQNTLETSFNYLSYSQKYLGGFIGYNESTVTITDAFFTGSLITDAKRNAAYIGTAIGRDGGSETLIRTYYSMVEFRTKQGGIDYVPYNPAGVMTTLVNQSTMPNSTWWNTYSTIFYSSNSLWTQDISTGRLLLIR